MAYLKPGHFKQDNIGTDGDLHLISVSYQAVALSPMIRSMTRWRNPKHLIQVFTRPWQKKNLSSWFGWVITGIPGMWIMAVPGDSGTVPVMTVAGRFCKTS